jgi:hypothetical protein
MLVVETFTADKIRLRIYAIIGWGKEKKQFPLYIKKTCYCARLLMRDAGI